MNIIHIDNTTTFSLGLLDYFMPNVVGFAIRRPVVVHISEHKKHTFVQSHAF